jgi:hypothetical protein
MEKIIFKDKAEQEFWKEMFIIAVEEAAKSSGNAAFTPAQYADRQLMEFRERSKDIPEYSARSINKII